MVEGGPRRNHGAPVAALHAVGAAIIELFVDQGVPQAGDGARADRARAAVVADRRGGEGGAGRGGREARAWTARVPPRRPALRPRLAGLPGLRHWNRPPVW